MSAAEPFDTIYVRRATESEARQDHCACPDGEDATGRCTRIVSRYLTLERVAATLPYCEFHYQIIAQTAQSGWAIKPVTLMGQP